MERNFCVVRLAITFAVLTLGGCNEFASVQALGKTLPDNPITRPTQTPLLPQEIRDLVGEFETQSGRLTIATDGTIVSELKEYVIKSILSPDNGQGAREVVGGEYADCTVRRKFRVEMTNVADSADAAINLLPIDSSLVAFEDQSAIDGQEHDAKALCESYIAATHNSSLTLPYQIMGNASAITLHFIYEVQTSKTEDYRGEPQQSTIFSRLGRSVDVTKDIARALSSRPATYSSYLHETSAPPESEFLYDPQTQRIRLVDNICGQSLSWSVRIAVESGEIRAIPTASLAPQPVSITTPSTDYYRSVRQTSSCQSATAFLQKAKANYSQLTIALFAIGYGVRIPGPVTDYVLFSNWEGT